MFGFHRLKGDFMKDVLRLKMLLILQNNGTITDFIKDGFTYGQVAEMINKIVVEGYARESEGEIIITDKGKEWVTEFNNTNQLKGSKSWILPEEKSRIEKIDKNEVYLPSRNELHF